MLALTLTSALQLVEITHEIIDFVAKLLDLHLPFTYTNKSTCLDKLYTYF